jgi:hypothetical protein
MARYFLHLRDGSDEVLDEEGIDYSDMNAVREAVVKSARDIMAGQIRDLGVLDLRFRIDADNEAGETVYALLFTDAISIVTP